MQVQEPDEAGPCVIIADCPTIAHVPQLQQLLPASLFGGIAAPAPGDEPLGGPVNCIIHLSPAHVSYQLAPCPSKLFLACHSRVMEGTPVAIDIPALLVRTRAPLLQWGACWAAMNIWQWAVLRAWPATTIASKL